jgi:hypothetical protein
MIVLSYHRRASAPPWETLMTRRWAIIFLFILTTSETYAYSGSLMDGLVTCKYEPVSGGYRYYVTIHNNELPATQAYVTGLDFLLSGGMTNVTSPPYWSYTSDLFIGISWAESRGGENYQFGIAPNYSLSGFEFTSPKLKAQIQYHGYGDTDTIPLRFSGYTVPQLVPEPSSLIVLHCGLGAVGLGRVRHKRAIRHWRNP